MKKIMMLSSVLASALMLTVVSCSSDDVTGGDAQTGNGTTSYLAVNLKTVGNAPTGNARQTRASYTDSQNGQYEDGVGVENKITGVRFYFFNADGTPYILNNVNSSKVNYIDRTIKVNQGDQSQTVEGITETVLVLNGENHVAPASMLTVINPDVNPDLLQNGASLRWSVMRKELIGTKFSDDTHFMMSNSTYEEAGNDICTTQLTGKTYASSDAAQSNPVNVYVERVNAKVNANVVGSNFESETADVIFDGVSMKDKQKTKVGVLSLAKEDGTSDDKDIFAYIVGWGLASENGKAELFKQINTQKFTDEILGIYPWSSADYHRSFWALSVPFGGTGVDKNEPVNHKFSDYTHSLGEAVYTLPNTPTVAIDDAHIYDNSLTKFVVAARLAYKDADGSLKPAEICEYKGQEFLGTDNLKKVFLNEISRYYKKVPVTAGEPDKYENLTPSDITFTTTAPSGTQAKDYEVFAKLANPGITLYEQKGGVWKEVTDLSVVNNMLQEAPAEVRTGGMAYYYTTIKHLGKKGTSGEPKLGEYGIVRNHSYQISLNSIKGFGTPVYNPDNIIVPAIPSDDKTYLAAKINVLSWRVVPSKVDLDKTEKK